MPSGDAQKCIWFRRPLTRALSEGIFSLQMSERMMLDQTKDQIHPPDPMRSM
jgi:hypothetical protein